MAQDYHRLLQFRDLRADVPGVLILHRRLECVDLRFELSSIRGRHLAHEVYVWLLQSW